MAIEPYRPNGPGRDETDRDLEKKIDKFFHRWNWKLVRLVRTLVFIAAGIWLAMNMLPPVIDVILAGEAGQVILRIIPIVIQLFFFIGFQFFLMYFFMARTRIYWVLPGETGIGFKDYRGDPEVLESARRIVGLLQGAKDFKQMGGEVTRGVLLIGPPGTGKSYLAQAISTEAGVPFAYMSAPSLQSAWMGMGNIKVMNLYRKARKLAREYGACIIFIDEIDAIGGARSSSLMGGATAFAQPVGDQRGERDNVMMGGGMGMGGGSGLLNELLLQMDPPPQETSMFGKFLRLTGLRKKKPDMPPVLTMGATNLAETLDAALLRPGRFDRKIVIDRPDAEGRREILEYYLSKVKHEALPMDRMIADTIYYTPVAIRYVINEAVVHAHFDGRQAINYWDFTQARELHEWGLKQPIRNLPYEIRRATAYHEAGHAYLQAKLIHRERITKVTIIRHGRAEGFVAMKRLDEYSIDSKQEVLDDMVVTIGGYAAEELFLGYTTTGVGGDMQQVTRRAINLVAVSAMDGTFFSYAATGSNADPALQARVEKILQEQYQRAKQLIENNREAVIAIAEALILRNELTDLDVNEILARAEAEHPFTLLNATKEQASFGFASGAARTSGTTIVRRHVRKDPPAPLLTPEITIIDAKQK